MFELITLAIGIIASVFYAIVRPLGGVFQGGG